MNKNWLMGFGLAFVLAACEQAIIPQPDSGPAEDFSGHPKHGVYQKAVEAYVKSNRIPGAVVLLKKEGEPVWIGAAGYANLEHQTPARINTPFRVGSITKTFVATAAMQLVDEGRLQLDRTLPELLPEVKDRIPQAEKITLRHLLTHTSGLVDPNNDDIQYQLDLVNNPARRRAMSADEVLSRYVYDRPLAFEPGERYGYSNPGYLLIGKILERVTGKSLAALVDERVVRPLGLTQTYLDRRDDRQVARGYAYFYGNNRLMDVTDLDRADAESNAYGGLISSAPDLFRFSEALFGGKLMSASALREMMTPFPVRKGESTYGLALDQWPSSVLGTGFGNNGTLAGAESNVFYFPAKKATFVLLTNYGTGTRKDFLEEVLN
ncbi:serine hydrolase domain-containing protein [Tellurirhabdus rosea]|uniref:serine hydrolase domain-containing protein n=1 Tax=Tellurirhabdus rosea TaxID=2674997 RepID=UPI0022564EED|nr:serine hydrolase domain-containing protein [Tellurirhabdus rosea]